MARTGKKACTQVCPPLKPTEIPLFAGSRQTVEESDQADVAMSGTSFLAPGNRGATDGGREFESISRTTRRGRHFGGSEGLGSILHCNLLLFLSTAMASMNCALFSWPFTVTTPRQKRASSARRSSASGRFQCGCVRVTSALEERSYNPNLLPGDGIGPETMKAAVDVMGTVGDREDGGKNAQDDQNEQGDGEEEDDYPMWMEEDDPTWPEGEDEGYGFQVSQFFEKWGNVKVKNVDEDGKIVENEKETGDEDEDLALKWEEEEDLWIVREINFLEWDLVALQDPTPLIVLGFERYGSSGANGWALLKELEIMLKGILDSRKYPVRAVKFDVNIEQDLAASLKVKSVPALLFIKAGKLVYRMTGIKSADELLLITSHLFYHSSKPACMDDDKTSESVTNIR